MFIRRMKGILMGLIFLFFGLGILIEVLILSPFFILLTLNKKNKYPMQNVNRKAFAFWLFLLRFGLLKERPFKGEIYDKPCIVIANHPGLFDTFFLMKEIPKLSLLAKRTLVEKLPFGPIFKYSGYVIPKDSTPNSSLLSLLDASKKIEEGNKFLIFPEGTRSPENGLYKFKAGAFKIAQKLNVPIQPVIIRNTPPFLPKGTPWYLPPKKYSIIEFEYLEPIMPPEKKGINKFVKEIETLYYNKLNLPFE